ncbi:MAG: phospholipid carrier-dependent glycosyltransferase [Prevotellaceae bacterium]|jgi:tetratricopeptide (TPR) repeat protein|nr:phospholipid carrier-dependent glycosyltransferase [Prevotellaceae bacterium]
MKQFYLTNKRNAWFWTFAGLMVVLLFAFPLMSRDAGMSGDEMFHIPQAKHVLQFYQTLGKDTTAISQYDRDGNIREYGQMPDNLAELIATVFRVEDILAVRHAINALFGWLGALFAALLAYRVSRQWFAAVVTALLLFLSPRYLGHSFNNLKDIPFAAMMMMGIYYIVRFLQEFPKPPLRVCAMLAVSIGIATGTRVGGFLLVAYFGLFGLSYFVSRRLTVFRKREKIAAKKPGKKAQPQLQPQRQTDKLFVKLLAYGLAIFVAGYVLAVLIWPYALVSPLKNVVTAFQNISHFKTSIRQNFEGAMQWSSALPWYYTPKFILISVPIAAIVGAAAYLFAGGLKKENRLTTFIVYFSFIFPVFWIVYSNANVYGGWRHSLFAYPPMVVAAGLGFSAMMNAAKGKLLKIACAALPLLLLLSPIAFIVRNHPYEYVYFNRFAGGIKAAFGSYEMDYYYHSTREASEWIKTDVAKNGAPDSTRKVRVVTWHVPSVSYVFRKDTADFSVGFVRWNERGYSDWDYAVFAVTGINPELLKNKRAFPPKNTVYRVSVDSVPIGIVLKREDKSDYYGHKAMQQGQVDEAIIHLRKALEYDGNNEQALDDLINIYSRIEMPDSALMRAKYWVKLNPGNPSALNHLATLYFNKGDRSNALLTANAITRLNPGDISGLWIAANVYVQENNPTAALRNLNRILQIRGNFKPAYQLMAQIYSNAGNHQQAQRIIDAMNSIR